MKNEYLWNYLTKKYKEKIVKILLKETDKDENIEIVFDYQKIIKLDNYYDKFIYGLFGKLIIKGCIKNYGTDVEEDIYVKISDYLEKEKDNIGKWLYKYPNLAELDVDPIKNMKNIIFCAIRNRESENIWRELCECFDYL